MRLTQRIINILDKEYKEAKACIDYHVKEGDAYNLAIYFKGRLSAIRKLKTVFKKISNGK